MYSKRKVRQVFKNNPPGGRLRQNDQKTDGGTVYKQILTDAKLTTGRRAEKKELTWRSSLTFQSLLVM